MARSVHKGLSRNRRWSLQRLISSLSFQGRLAFADDNLLFLSDAIPEVRLENTAEDILDTAYLWLKADAIDGSDGDNISTWVDSSGNGRNVVRQVEEDDHINLHVEEETYFVRFDGENYLYRVLDFNNGHDYTIISVFRHTEMNTSAPTVAVSFGNFPSGSDPTYWTGCGVSGGHSYIAVSHSFDDLLGVEDDLSWHSTIGVKSATTLYGFADGESIGSSSLTGGSGTYLSIGNYMATSNSFEWIGDIAEVIVFNYQLNPSDRTVVQNYLVDKYPELDGLPFLINNDDERINTQGGENLEFEN